MTIAIDIDDTWTLAPSLFLNVCWMFQHAGWTVIIVTGAKQPVDKIKRLGIPEDIEIIVALNRFKRQAAKEAGYDVDVWMDDMPGTIEPQRILTEGSDKDL